VRYFGGKAKIAKELASIINLHILPGQRYFEPFCGGLNVTALIRTDRVRVAMDLNLDLITLYKAIQKGWEIPGAVTEESYAELKASAGPSAARGFAGFACSFAGKFFGGYARDKRKHGAPFADTAKRGLLRKFADTAKRGLLRKFETLDDAIFMHGSFFDLNVSGDVIYCDPPYRGTTAYKTGPFDSDAFWQKVRDLSKNNLVFVSEYEAPDDFITIWSKEVKTEIRGGSNARLDRVEKLFIYL